MAFNTIQIPSVCLPRVYHKFDQNYVEQVFCELFGPDVYGESCVEKVDIIVRQDRRTNEPFHVAFVHFSENMAPTEYVVDFSKRILADEEVKVQYDYPWFWKVRQNSNNKGVANGPRIMSKCDEEDIMETQRNILQNRAVQKLRIDIAEKILKTTPPPLVMPCIEGVGAAIRTPPPPLVMPSPRKTHQEETEDEDEDEDEDMETMMTPKSSNSSRKSWSELDAEDDDE
jgi:hypothetical protein